MNKRGLLLLTLFMMLAGCVTEKHPPVSIYALSPNSGVVKPSTDTEHITANILKLGRIRSTQAFSNTGLLYTDAQYGQNRYAYSRWSDSPTAMLLLVFQDALEKSGRFKAVVSYSSQSQSDLLLESTLIDFSHRINDDGTSDGIFRIRFYLVDNKTKRVIASREFVSSVSASQQNAQGAVAALNKAAAVVTQDLINWLN